MYVCIYVCIYIYDYKGIKYILYFMEKTIGKHMILIGCDLKSVFSKQWRKCVCVGNPESKGIGRGPSLSSLVDGQRRGQ